MIKKGDRITTTDKKIEGTVVYIDADSVWLDARTIKGIELKQGERAEFAYTEDTWEKINAL